MEVYTLMIETSRAIFMGALEHDSLSVPLFRNCNCSITGYNAIWYMIVWKQSQPVCTSRGRWASNTATNIDQPSSTIELAIRRVNLPLSICLKQRRIQLRHHLECIEPLHLLRKLFANPPQQNCVAGVPDL